MAEAVGIANPNDLAGNATNTRNNKHQYGKASCHDQQVIGRQRWQEMQKPSTNVRVAQTLRISRQRKEGKDRGDADKLEQPVKKDQAKNRKEP